MSWFRRSPKKESIREVAKKIAAGGSHNIPGKDKPALVPYVSKRPLVVFEDAPGGHEAGNAQCFSDGSAGQLRGMRPNVSYGQVWCGKCDKACDFDEFGLHNLFGKPDSEGNHRGYLGINATCHGETVVLSVSFQELRQNAGRRIMAFLRPEGYQKPVARLPGAARGLPETPKILLLMDKGQNYWTRTTAGRFIAIAFRRTQELDDFDRKTREIMERYEKRLTEKQSQR